MKPARRILVIDDNPEIHRDFRKVLVPEDSAGALAAAEAVLFGDAPAGPAQTGFAIDCASQGAEGLALADRAAAEGRPYAVAFVDMRMPPGWDGLETCSRLMAADPRLQLVICTAYSDHTWRQLVARLGAGDRLLILKKPFDPIEILQLAHALCAKWELARLADGERDRLERAVAERTAELALANSVLNRSVLELRTTVAQLGRSETRFRAVVESAAAAIAIIDARGAIWLWNPGAVRLFGWTAEEAVGRLIGGMVPELAAPERVPEGRPLETAGSARDGTRLDLEVSLSRWRSDDGEFASVIMLDLGARRQAENAIIQARDAAEAAASAKSDFLAVISHELRTPMNGIIGMSDLLLETDLDGEQREFAGTVRSCASSLLGMINEILDFSRIEAGRMEIHAIPFDPRGTCEDVVGLLALQARDKGLALSLEVHAGVPTQVSGDPARLRQILTNLVGNAVKFTAAGTVTVRMRTLPDVPDVVRLEVEDTGIGIAAEAQARLFEPFVQVESPETRRHGGTGLGLAICRRIAGLMGGRIGVDSATGRGSRFWCELPLPGCPEPGEPREAGGGDLSGCAILCVDPLASGREALLGVLAGCGATCSAVATADEALAACRTEEPPLAVVVECRHGHDAGLDLSMRLRAADGPPALLLVRDAHPGIGAEARQAGAAGLLTHPVRRTQLVEALRTIRRGGHVGTGMLTRHSLAEQRRWRRPRVLVAGPDGSVRRAVIMRLAALGCRPDVVHRDGLAELPAGRPYDLGVSIGGDDTGVDMRGHLTSGAALITLAPGEDGLPGGFDAQVRHALPALAGQRDEALDEIDQVTAAIAPGRLRGGALDDFAVALPASASALMLAIARNDAEAVRVAAAALRRRCSDAGALPLASLAEEFERLGEGRDLGRCAQAAGELHLRLRHALAAVERLRRGG